MSQEELEAATEEAAEEARKDAKEDAQIADLEDEIDALRKQKDKPVPDSVPPPTDNAGSSGGLPADAENCGSGVFALSGTTSCSFALNVAADFFAAGGSSSFDSFSPATGDVYRMNCTGGAVTTCTGGNNAAVYILSS